MDRLEHEAFKDPHAILRAALSDLVTAGLDAFTHWLRHEQTDRIAAYDDPRIIDRDDDDAHSTELIEAAALLGVRVDACADEVRAAFRRSVKAALASDSGFHDQGGDTTDPRAQELIAAKNLLIEHARKEHAHAAS